MTLFIVLCKVTQLICLSLVQQERKPNQISLTLTTNICIQISQTRGGGYDEYCPLGSDIMQHGKTLLTFGRNVLPLSSGLMSEEGKKFLNIQLILLTCK